MKKGIIVLLIAVLVAGFAFADGKANEAKFTGSATISYDYDFDKKDTGIVNAQAMKYNFKFEFNSATGESKGDGKLYAEIAATATLELEAKDVKATGDLTPKATLKISKANIVAGDVTIDILGPKGLYTFAEFYADDEYDDDYDPNYKESLADLGLDKHGLVVSYKDFAVSFAFWHEGDKPLLPTPVAANTKAYVGLKTPAFKLADGMTLTAGANFYFNKLDEVDDALIFVGGGFKFAYAPEDSKLSASLAADALDIMYGNSDNSILPIDIAAQVKYDFITFDAYFFTLDKFDKDLLNILAAKVSADYKVNDALKVGGYGEIIYEHIFQDDAKPAFRFGANVTYTAEKFTAKAGVDAMLQYVGDAYKLKGVKKADSIDGKDHPGLGITAEISSKAVIDNATVGVKWTGSDFAPNAEDKPTALGVVSAYITVEF